MNKHAKENIYYIDSLQAYDLALKFYIPNKDLLITDNTFIPNSSKIKNDIVDISELISQEKGNKIGEIVLSLCNDVENIFVKKNYNICIYC